MTGWNLPAGCTQADIDRAAAAGADDEPHDEQTELEAAYERLALEQERVGILLDQIQGLLAEREGLLAERDMLGRAVQVWSRN
jgi:hypothetical protein